MAEPWPNPSRYAGPARIRSPEGEKSNNVCSQVSQSGFFFQTSKRPQHEPSSETDVMATMWPSSVTSPTARIPGTCSTIPWEIADHARVPSTEFTKAAHPLPPSPSWHVSPSLISAAREPAPSTSGRSHSWLPPRSTTCGRPAEPSQPTIEPSGVTVREPPGFVPSETTSRLPSST